MKHTTQNGNQNQVKAASIAMGNQGSSDLNTSKLDQRDEHRYEVDQEKERIKKENLNKLIDWFTNHL